MTRNHPATGVSTDASAVPPTATTTASSTSPSATPSAAGVPERSPRWLPTSTSKSAMGPTTTSMGMPMATPMPMSCTNPFMV